MEMIGEFLATGVDDRDPLIDHAFFLKVVGAFRSHIQNAFDVELLYYLK